MEKDADNNRENAALNTWQQTSVSLMGYDALLCVTDTGYLGILRCDICHKYCVSAAGEVWAGRED